MGLRRRARPDGRMAMLVPGNRMGDCVCRTKGRIRSGAIDNGTRSNHDHVILDMRNQGKHVILAMRNYDRDVEIV